MQYAGRDTRNGLDPPRNSCSNPAKQSQFLGCQHEGKLILDKGLGDSVGLGRAQKQSQFKANRRPLAGNPKY